VKLSPDHGPEQIAEIRSDKKKLSSSKSNWNMVRFISRTKTFLGRLGFSDQTQEVTAKA